MLEQHDLLDVDVVLAGAGATQEPHETARAGLVGLTAWKRDFEPKNGYGVEKHHDYFSIHQKSNKSSTTVSHSGALGSKAR